MEQQHVSNYELHLQLCSLQRAMAGTKEVMTLQDVAAYTGLSLSYLYKLTMTGILPHAKPNGKQIFVSKKELDKWLLSNGRKDAEQLDIDAATYLATKNDAI
jgi:excisionase family DNA binding protein